jgi:hypothetical protein
MILARPVNRSFMQSGDKRRWSSSTIIPSGRFSRSCLASIPRPIPLVHMRRAVRKVILVAPRLVQHHKTLVKLLSSSSRRTSSSSAWMTLSTNRTKRNDSLTRQSSSETTPTPAKPPSRIRPSRDTAAERLYGWISSGLRPLDAGVCRHSVADFFKLRF